MQKIYGFKVRCLGCGKFYPSKLAKHGRCDDCKKERKKYLDRGYWREAAQIRKAKQEEK